MLDVFTVAVDGSGGRQCGTPTAAVLPRRRLAPHHPLDPHLSLLHLPVQVGSTVVVSLRKFGLRVQGEEKFLPVLKLILPSLVRSFCTCLFSLDWGMDKSKEWLGAFIMSLLMVATLMDPFMVSCVLPRTFDLKTACRRQLCLGNN